MAIYSLAAVALFGAIVFGLRVWLTDYSLAARFPVASGCEIRVWNAADSEPFAAHYCYEFLRQGRVEIPKTGFLWSNDTQAPFRLVAAPGCTVLGLSRHPETNRILMLVDAQAGSSEPWPRLLQKLQQCLPGRALIATPPEN